MTIKGLVIKDALITLAFGAMSLFVWMIVLAIALKAGAFVSLTLALIFLGHSAYGMGMSIREYLKPPPPPEPKHIVIDCHSAF